MRHSLLDTVKQPPELEITTIPDLYVELALPIPSQSSEFQDEGENSGTDEDPSS